MEACIELSELMMRIATHVICHTLVDYQEQLGEERLSIAHAMLQRVMTTHLCNHRLTADGLVYEYKGQPFELHEEYKTMTLTRSVYEHLAMFYFLFEHPKTDDERDIVWKYWQIGSCMSLQDSQGVEDLRRDIQSTMIGMQCWQKLDEWTRVGATPANGSIEFVVRNGKYDVRRVPFGQAWKYLFADEGMALFYRHLSMHCHPVYQGLVQYQGQGTADQGHDGIPLYFSCRFLAQLCRLFLKQIPDGQDILRREFSERDLSLFHDLSRSK